MQGGRANVGRTNVPMSGKLATRLSGSAQQQPGYYGIPQSPPAPQVPQPSTARPQAATPNAPRAGSRVITTVDSAGLIEAGKVTGSPPQPVQRPKPAS